MDGIAKGNTGTCMVGTDWNKTKITTVEIAEAER